MFILVAFSGVFTGQPSAGEKKPDYPVIRTGQTPLGLLGRPIGEYLTVEGQKYAPKVPLMEDTRRTLIVDTVNGKKLPKPVRVTIATIETLPDGVRCVFKGYESGGMLGLPPGAFKAAEEAGQPLEPRTLVWGWQFHFVVTSAVSPKGLKIQKGEER